MKVWGPILVSFQATNCLEITFWSNTACFFSLCLPSNLYKLKQLCIDSILQSLAHLHFPPSLAKYLPPETSVLLCLSKACQSLSSPQALPFLCLFYLVGNGLISLLGSPQPLPIQQLGTALPNQGCFLNRATTCCCKQSPVSVAVS